MNGCDMPKALAAEARRAADQASDHVPRPSLEGSAPSAIAGGHGADVVGDHAEGDVGFDLGAVAFAGQHFEPAERGRNKSVS